MLLAAKQQDVKLLSSSAIEDILRRSTSLYERIAAVKEIRASSQAPAASQERLQRWRRRLTVDGLDYFDRRLRFDNLSYKISDLVCQTPGPVPSDVHWLTPFIRGVEELAGFNCSRIEPNGVPFSAFARAFCAPADEMLSRSDHGQLWNNLPPARRIRF